MYPLTANLDWLLLTQYLTLNWYVREVCSSAADLPSEFTIEMTTI
jgi:hypothetical protein